MIYQQLSEYHGKQIRMLLLYLLYINPGHKLEATISELMCLLGIANEDYIKYYNDKCKSTYISNVEVELYEMMDIYRKMIEDELIYMQDEKLIKLVVIPIVQEDTSILYKYEIIFNKSIDDYKIEETKFADISSELNKQILDEILASIKANHNIKLFLQDMFEALEDLDKNKNKYDNKEMECC